MERLLIETLADGEFHSGQDLGRLLGVSRTAVWKHLQKLDALGIAVESVKGKGYRLPGGLELLDKGMLEQGLDNNVKSLIREVIIQEVVDSTNRYVAELEGNGHRVVCLAESQSSGRGRRGRKWSSPYGKNIYLSLGWQFEGGAASLEGLSLAVGVAVRRALGGGDHLKLKWPNDVLYDDRKLAGILLEMQGDPSGECRVVVGIGINAGMAGRQRADIDQPWADLDEMPNPGRNRVAANVISEAVAVLSSFGEAGFAMYVDEWNSCDAYRDQPVRLITPAMENKGIARGVVETGAIKIEIDGDLNLFHGGELSLRPVK